MQESKKPLLLTDVQKMTDGQNSAMSSKPQGKQQEFQRREALIISEAANLLQSEGYFGLSLDKLAQAIGYSKGTIYQHFGTKEDIILAIASQSMRARVGLFQRAAAFDGNPRERMCALSVSDRIFVSLYPGHFHVEHLIKARSLWAKTSNIRQTNLQEAEGDCGQLVNGIVIDAIESGDLELIDKNPAEVGLGLWTMSLGVHTLVCSAGLAGAPDLPKFGIDNPYLSLWRNQLAFLDGLGWKPLSNEWDYLATRERVKKEIFNEECKQITIE